MSLTLRKVAQQLPLWAPSLGAYGATLGLTGLYFSDWRVIVEYIPFYNGKFKKDD